MSSFTERVNATLPVEDPDYILLTLVQGHAGQACGRGCPVGQTANDSGRCLPNAVIASSARRISEAERKGAVKEPAREMVRGDREQVVQAAPVERRQPAPKEAESSVMARGEAVSSGAEVAAAAVRLRSWQGGCRSVRRARRASLRRGSMAGRSLLSRGRLRWSVSGRRNRRVLRIARARSRGLSRLPIRSVSGPSRLAPRMAPRRRGPSWSIGRRVLRRNRRSSLRRHRRNACSRHSAIG